MANELKTPYFVLDREALLNELQKLNAAADSYWPNTIAAYSVKTNSLPYLAKLLHEQGVYAEVVSEDEYDMVRLCGYDNLHIVCNGPVKSQAFIEQLMSSGAMVNIDSHAELEYAVAYAEAHPEKEYGVGLRVNVDVERYFPTESKAGDKGSRFGFCMENEELGNAIAQIEACSNLYVNGLHLHVSTSTRKVEIYRWLSGLFADLVEKYNLKRIAYFDIGGGFFGGMPNRPGWNEYLSSISEELANNGFKSENLALILEPGVSLLAGAFNYYSKVVDVKDTNRSRFVVMDGSRIHIDPFFHKTTYFYEHLTDEQREIEEKQYLVGFTCLEYDDIMTLENKPEMRVGDVVRFDKLGAYTLTLSPLFISYFPAVYVREADGRLECVRDAGRQKNLYKSQRYNK